MNEEAREIREPLNQWWREEEIPEEELRARVVMIYKKGDTSKYENYRPISLLNTLYKIYAAIVQKRLAEKLDKHLTDTIRIQKKQRNSRRSLLSQKNGRIWRKNKQQTNNGTTRLGESFRQGR